MKDINVSKEIERLLQFALQNKLIDELDVICVRNSLLDLLKVSEPYAGTIEKEELEYPTEVLENILDYAAENGIIEHNSTTYRDLLDAKIMGLLMPRQSEVIKDFYDTYKKYGAVKATDDFYAMSKASNYIRMDRIKKNLYWTTDTEYGSLEITVNLSKPEKDPKAIAAAKLMTQFSYPKCLLCKENVGYAGHVAHPARQNHRIIPVELLKEQWYLQYSPYVYYNEHCIVFRGEHVPMAITNETFRRLLGFVEKFPHYFVGSNADLPIVGGSILTHDHFQGGHHVFPMEVAAAQKEFKHPKYRNVKASIVKWPLSVIRLASKDKEELVNLCCEILSSWRKYSDKEVDILAFSEKDAKQVPHNTITPIARVNKLGEYEVDLVLRNNRTTEQYPDGIFHPHKELHHIKKENIGLIEVMGLAVLPARLEKELSDIHPYLKGQKDAKDIDETSELFKHKKWIADMVDQYGNTSTEEQAQAILKNEVGNIFLKVLLDAGVYKNDAEGRNGFYRFMESNGFIIL
ncbi:UDP-glucose--hexose-1-phosphate uridylyltransferase [Clostridium oryzae]|uniref:Galactose-1-phosphate uridylyltransferase n=1 Tax=Clostridium oryzae TaxID=1450648 RepID=A0A1V4IU72_9CLOT|nr:UDP-glucose--hexose-1-phosphate uridylyltransferase [Clostridium oryzae]OPJ63360.1 galactose-1-phosphate uridylyltransferase [Clostridium oryzae]